MTLRISEETAGAIPWRACLPFFVAAITYLTILLSGKNLLGDADSYWHVVVGHWIVDHHAFPTSDSFSFTFAGSHWIAKEWLSQLLYAGTYALAGWPGMAILAAASVGVAFALLTRWLEAELSPMAVLVLLAAAFVLVTPHLTARPHVLAWPVMVAWVGGVVRAADRGKAPSLLLLPLMVLWANLHGGFTLGILLAGIAGLDALVSARPEDRLRTAGIWLRFGVLTLVAACITPYGPESMLVTYRILGMGQALGIIGEWRPADFSHIGSFEVVFFLTLGFAFWRGFVLRPVRILAVLLLLHLALSAARNAELLGFLLPIFLADPLARRFSAFRPLPTEPLSRSGIFVAAAVVAALVPASLAVAWAIDIRPTARITPAAAVAALRTATTGPVLNSYDFGGYLIANGIPTFIDGRTELYGAAFLRRYRNAVMLDDLNDFLRLLDEYRITATLLETDTPAIALLDRLPGWKRLYADDIAVVHVRDPAPP